FSLTVPTGGGKTLASLAFALRHADRHQKRRVIVVAPFLAIIEQNAEVIRTALGSDAETTVLEHHSQADEPPGDDGQQSLEEVRRQLIAENWDAPVVITTTVQFFESLFSNRPGQVRKVHNIAGSVIVFDEAQTFPPGILRPLVGMLEQLVEEYGCTVVFATATQPALSHPRLREKLLQEVSREIIPNPAELFQRLKRVELDWSRATQPTPLSAIAEEMALARQALAIVNTKQQARELYAALVARDEKALHLSGRMCPAHRLQVLEGVRERLAAGEECRVASTSSLEAGVDVSFPRLWRALAPFDSIAQAAGRCNRDGRLDRGQVIVFEPEDGKAPPGVYARGREVTSRLLPRNPSIDNPDDFARYFTSLYNNMNLDSDHIVAKRMALEFPDVAKLRVIDEQTTPVLVAFGEGKEIIDGLLGGQIVFVDRQLRRRMERYMVALYPSEFEAARDAGWVVEVAGVWLAPANYDQNVGLTFDDGVLVD
ncbi:MAG: CRISPR-associated helicase Cas3', partial [Dehalococcoidia bacterium]|nr:CRISPR-associated helicase Cas3' [Dehalococcoidia bacterium]